MENLTDHGKMPLLFKFKRSESIVQAQRLTISGSLKTPFGKFKFTAGDWAIMANGRIWICEKKVFDQLYNPVEDG